jgi:hypothetical protein
MHETAAAVALWRRLDTPGHDACRLDPGDGGWRLDGTAVFLHEGEPARIDYHVACDGRWRTDRGQNRGFIGARTYHGRNGREATAAWTVNGVAVPGLEACVDLDLGFTPATNLTQLRRVALAPGQAAQVPVAWIDAPDGVLQALPQRYERRSATTYWYESPTAGYAELLELAPSGFVSRYPGLWEAVA